MFTTLYVFAMLPVLAALLYLLGVVRTWRRNRHEAALMLLFWPAGLYVLVRYWSDEDSGPRIPLVAAFGTITLWFGLIVWGLTYEPPERGFAAGGEVGVDSADEEGGVQTDLRRSIALANLASRGGRVELAQAKAAIEVPAHFRFVDRSALEALDGEDAPAATTIGWLVHESVDLSAPDAWHVEVDWLGDGYVAANGFAMISEVALLARAQDVWRKLTENTPVPTLAGYADMPELDASRTGVTWVEKFEATDTKRTSLDCYAARLGRRGALVFTISELAAPRRELCLLSVRLLAGRSAFARGEDYADHGLMDRKAGYDLAGLVVGENLLQLKR